MKYSKIKKIEAVVISLFFLGTMLVIPMTGAFNMKINKNDIIQQADIDKSRYDTTEYPSEDEFNPMRYDTMYIPKEDFSLAGEQNDIGYNCDAGDDIKRPFRVYVGEPVDQNKPGSGRTGRLDPDDGDEADWYMFSVCEGQALSATLDTSEDYDYEFSDSQGDPVGQSYIAVETDEHFFQIYAKDGAIGGDYTFDIILSGQNDAGKGIDAGNSISQAMSISSGSYVGYMDHNDREDWYSFHADSGQGIFVTLEPIDIREGDFDIHLYNPSDEWVYSATYYGEDELEYPADVSGTWKIKIDTFPGWDTSKWPDDYFLYGSGAYTLDLSIGGTAQAPPGPVPQPDINPIAQTFIVDDDPNSNKDEYSYLAAVPAANYLDNEERYLSPIVYQGVDFVPTWFTTVDETTQYLLDDWNTYLERHGKTAQVYHIPDDPITAAADIAKDKWSSSDTAVIAVDGSSFTDEIKTVVNRDALLYSPPQKTVVKPGEFSDIEGLTVSSVPMLLLRRWGAIHLVGKGDDFAGDTGLINPRYENVMEDWWPYPHDSNGEDVDTFYPVINSGLWFPYVTDETGLEELQIIKYKGDRYRIPIDNTDSSIKVTVTTNSPSNLIVYLIDPKGNVRRPMVPHYNGGEIKPIHNWNGGHW